MVDYNYKGQLIELCQKEGIELPVFQTESVVGPDHARIYTIFVLIRGKKLGMGKGLTKKAAEQEAAKVAILKLQSTDKDIG